MDSMNPCCCCLLRLPEKELKTPYIRLGVTENFAEMLEECFQIQLAVNEDGWGICEVCVNRLRDASDFKLQVQRSQAELRARLESHVEKPIELKLSYDDDVIDNEETVIPDLTSEATSVFPELVQPGAFTEQLATYSNTTKMYETVLQCDLCLSKFVQQWTLDRHMKKMHNNLAIQPKNEACNTFEKQFTMFCSSNKYKKGQHKPLRRIRGPYTCKTCSDVFYSRKLLAEHQRIHKKKKVHSCEICSRIFKRKYKMIEHMRTHTGQKPFSCEICNKSFTTNSGLKDHKRLHTGDVFICDICNKQYTKKHVLVSHLRVHTGSKPYECEICNKRFTYRPHLETHRSVHSEEKPYSCDVCGKRFKRKAHLKEHSLGHSGQKPYSCEICGNKFTAKSHVKKHKIKLHAQNV